MSKKSDFLSKDNITRLYKETIANTNLQGLPRESKSMVVEIVTNKMKDVYKSIDSNALVWTGFEVLGDDLENFIFNDTTKKFEKYNKKLLDNFKGKNAKKKSTS